MERAIGNISLAVIVEVELDVFWSWTLVRAKARNRAIL